MRRLAGCPPVYQQHACCALQAAQDNTFMHSAASSAAPQGKSMTQLVLREFSGLHAALTEGAGVRVKLFEHAASHGTPDACFPNNWFSHACTRRGWLYSTHVNPGLLPYEVAPTGSQPSFLAVYGTQLAVLLTGSQGTCGAAFH